MGARWGAYYSTQVPGLLCGFYSKITIPESDLIWCDQRTGRSCFSSRTDGKTDVGEFRSESSDYKRVGGGKTNLIEMYQGPVRHPTDNNAAGARLVQHQPIKWMSARCSPCFQSRSMWIAGYCFLRCWIHHHVCVFMCVCLCVRDGKQAAPWRSQHIRLSYRYCECGVHFPGGRKPKRPQHPLLQLPH